MSRNKFYGVIIGLILCTLLIVAGSVIFTHRNVIFNKNNYSAADNSTQNAESDSENTAEEQKKSVLDRVIDVIWDDEISWDDLTSQNGVLVISGDNEDGDNEEESKLERVEELETVSPEGARIWPLKNLTLYGKAPNEGLPLDNASDDAKSKAKQLEIGSIPKGTPLKVEKQEGTYFFVSYNNQGGFIDNRYCLINLPDYLGDNLLYNITNSYSSIFMAHDYSIYGITGTILPGYEEVDLGNGEYLVPYLYPCANKLYPVALKVKEDGYILRIYDAFRPYETTRFIYDTTESYLNKSVPLKDEEGNEIIEIDELTGEPVFGEVEKAPYGSVVYFDGSLVLPDMTQVAPPGTVTEYAPGSVVIEDGIVVDATGNILGVLEISSGETYANVITGGRYSLGAFLAKQASAHNKGIALDLTLVDARTGEELPMQTAMHDLSYHSVLASNNENANLLAKYMKDGGFNDLTSEWWHFQDDATRNELKINFLLETGVKTQ